MMCSMTVGTESNKVAVGVVCPVMIYMMYLMRNHPRERFLTKATIVALTEEDTIADNRPHAGSYRERRGDELGNSDSHTAILL